MLCCVVPAFIYIGGSAIFSGCAWLLYAFRDLFGWNTHKPTDYERSFGAYDGLDAHHQGKNSLGILTDLEKRPCCQKKQTPAQASTQAASPTPQVKSHGCCAARAAAKQGFHPSPSEVPVDIAPKLEPLKPAGCCTLKS